MSRVINRTITFGLVAGLFLTAGEPQEPLPYADAASKAQELILDDFNRADNAELFAKQYLQDGRLQETVTVGDRRGGSGWLGIITGITEKDIIFLVGQVCLDDRVYDIENDVEGQNVRPVYPDSLRPWHETLADGTFVVHPSPAGEHKEPISFNVDEKGILSPADETTRFILERAGCVPFYEHPHIVEDDPGSPRS